MIRPYLNGDDINTQLRQATRRWVIDFGTMSRAEAAQYQDCFDILTRLVKPYRDTLTKQVHESDYWKFWTNAQTAIVNRDVWTSVGSC